MELRKFSTAVMALVAVFCLSKDAWGRPLSPREIYKTYGNAVVLVFATDGSQQGSAGSGSVIAANGQVVTNAHVVAKGNRPYKKLFVYLKPKKISGSMKDDLKHRYRATLVDMDSKLDLALLKIVDPPENLMVMDFANPAEVEIGEPVVAIGHPETGGLWTLTSGSVSSVVKDFQGIKGKDVFQTEASVNRGNSGGPLINAYGQMVGINTSISRKANDGLAITDINFSLKSSVAVDWMRRRQLMDLAYAPPAAVRPEVLAALAPSKPVVVADSGQGPAKTVTDKASGTKIAVVEPSRGQDVAEDPGFSQAASADAQVSRGMAGRGKKAAPKQLTRRRPYRMNRFVAARLREIRALERDMESMSQEIERRFGKGKRPSGAKNGNGLW